MDVSQLCSELVKIKSPNPPGSTEKVISFIRNLLAAEGVGSTVTGCGKGRSSLVTEPATSGLLLCGHVDVVPALKDGWSVPPYSGKVHDGAVWGRGATDMKGGCAALISAFLAFYHEHGTVPAQLAFVCDEETGGECGIRRLIEERLIAPCDCLIAEPTPARHPNIGQKGLVRLEMRFSGSPAHGSLYPAVGRSAIVEALSFVGYLQSLNRRKFTSNRDLQEIIDASATVLSTEFDMPHAGDILTGIMFNPGIISGGEKSNIVAQRCDLSLEMRIPWGCDIDALLKDIRANAPHGAILSETSNMPSFTDPHSKIATTTCSAIRKVCGGDVFPIVQWAASDARHLRIAGFRVVEYGPGELHYLHAIDEHVAIEALERAERVYAAILQEYAAGQIHS